MAKIHKAESSGGDFFIVISAIVLEWIIDHLFLSFILFGILPYCLLEGIFKGWQSILNFSIGNILYNLVLCGCFFLGAIIILLLLAAIEYPSEIIARCFRGKD